MSDEIIQRLAQQLEWGWRPEVPVDLSHMSAREKQVLDILEESASKRGWKIVAEYRHDYQYAVSVEAVGVEE